MQINAKETDRELHKEADRLRNEMNVVRHRLAVKYSQTQKYKERDAEREMH